MISVFQIEVGTEDEAAFDSLFQTKLSGIINAGVDRFGQVKTIQLLKGDAKGSTSTYIVVVGIDGLGMSFGRVFSDAGFPASIKVTALSGAYHQTAKWPDTAPDIGS